MELQTPSYRMRITNCFFFVYDSETVLELMKLAHTMLEEACNTTQPSTSSQIVYAVRSMFELYTSVVSDYHKQSITDLPQVTGKITIKLFR